jgi:hypothetical protein
MQKLAEIMKNAQDFLSVSLYDQKHDKAKQDINDHLGQ